MDSSRRRETRRAPLAPDVCRTEELHSRFHPDEENSWCEPIVDAMDRQEVE